jgi:hypothetical protein
LTLFKSDPLAPGAGGVGDDWNATVIASLRKQMLDYIPMRDYLIPTGKPLKMCVLAMLAVERGPRHKFLVWDQKYYRYIEHVVDLTR